MSEIISREALREIAQDWLQQGGRVFGPVRMESDLVLYSPVTDPQLLLLDGWIRPANSIKAAVLPRHEKLYEYRLQGREVELIPVDSPKTPQLVLGARPCDAGALPILDHVFNWDYRDEPYNTRRQATTVVTIACQDHDNHCFCTSLGLGPDDPTGSDAMLVDLGDGTYEVRILTEKGRSVFHGKTQTAQGAGQVKPGPEKILDLKAIYRFLSGGFESPRWTSLALRCLGCASCAYHCPTCHCFDMVDTGGLYGGAKVRNWDACQFGIFTAHASGHNPRSTQAQRQRQRIYHKFHIYKEKFNHWLCTGCGNCTRNCPVSLGIRPVLESIQKDFQ